MKYWTRGLFRGESKKSVNKSFLVAILIAVLLIGGGILLIWKLQPSMQEQQEQVLSGALREGAPDFETATRRIVAETNEAETWSSPVGTGGIMMQIAGRIRNNSDKIISGLEIKVSVVDLSGKVVKDSTLLVVPNQKKKNSRRKNKWTSPSASTGLDRTTTAPIFAGR
jgi:hypothetical protein